MSTNTASDWLTGSGGNSTITYAESGTVSVGVTVSASVSVSAGAIIAESEVTFGVDLTAGYSHSTSWNYTIGVPNGTTMRLVRTHEGRKISFTLYRDKSNCTTSTYTGAVYAPRASNSPTYYCWKGDVYPETKIFTPNATGGC